MKQTVLMMVLALGMCSTIALSQTTRECIVEDDGFEWYKTKGTKGSVDVYGVEDRNGNIILPCAFGIIEYDHYREYSSGLAFGAGFKVWKPFPWKSSIERDCVGYYLRNGKCIIPFARSLAEIRKITNSLMGTYYECVKLADRQTDWRKVICDVNGKEIIVFDNIDYRNVEYLDFCQEKGVFYIQIDGRMGHGLADGNGKIIVAPKSGQPKIVLSEDGRNFGFTDYSAGYSESKWISLTSVTSMSTKVNPLANNPKEDPEATLLLSTQRSNNTSSSPTLSNNSSGNSSGVGTTTIVVEHQHTPQPVQQWQACWACGGMGTMGCDNCGGSGTKYIGDRLHKCSRCNGGGLIPCNICNGNKGQYITVYR